MSVRKLVITLIVLLTALSTTMARAQLPQISNGLSYLASSQNQDGTWNADTSIVETTAAAVSVLDTLKLLNQGKQGPSLFPEFEKWASVPI